MVKPTEEGQRAFSEFLTLKEACACFDPPPSWSTINRWARLGFYRGTLKLKTKRRGKLYFTTAAWCREFEAELNQRNGAAVDTPRQKKARVKKMRDELRANGHKV